jgi:hypothetical protein
MIVRSLQIQKNDHLYVFRYAPGNEDELVDELIRLAEDDLSPIDWLDAATLSFQVTHQAAEDCCKALSPEDNL